MEITVGTPNERPINILHRPQLIYTLIKGIASSKEQIQLKPTSATDLFLSLSNSTPLVVL